MQELLEENIFQNISCLRLMLKEKAEIEEKLNFKTFHVYG